MQNPYMGRAPWNNPDKNNWFHIWKWILCTFFYRCINRNCVVRFDGYLIFTNNLYILLSTVITFIMFTFYCCLNELPYSIILCTDINVENQKITYFLDMVIILRLLTILNCMARIYLLSALYHDLIWYVLQYSRQ